MPCVGVERRRNKMGRTLFSSQRSGCATLLPDARTISLFGRVWRSVFFVFVSTE